MKTVVTLERFGNSMRILAYQNGKVRRLIDIESRLVPTFHRYPDWMGLHLHIAIEHFLMSLPEIVRFKIPITRIIYHFLFGLTCGYSINEILSFIRRDLERLGR